MDTKQDQGVKLGRPLPVLSRSDSSGSTGDDDEIIQSQGGSMDELVAAVDSLRGEHSILSTEDLKLKLEAIASTLNVDDATISTALELLESLQLTNDLADSNIKYCAITSLFISGNRKFNNILSGGSAGSAAVNSVYLSQLLKSTNVPMLQFFEVAAPFMMSMMNNDLSRELLDAQFKKLSQGFIILNIIYRKYEELFQLIFKWSLATSSLKTINSSSKQHATEEYLFSVGWLLYLHCKSKLYNDKPDLLQSIHIIFCCLNLLYFKSPSNSKKLTFDNENNNKQQSNNSDKVVLEYLCKSINGEGQMKELVNTNQKVFSPIINDIVKNKTLKTSEGDDYFSNITLLSVNFAQLNKLYEHQYYSSGDIDERVFLFDKEIVGTPFKASTSIRKSNLVENPHGHQHHTRVRQPLFGSNNENNINNNNSNSLSSGTPSSNGYPTTPSKSHGYEVGRAYPPQTPVSATVTMVNWVKQTVSNSDIVESVSALVKECVDSAAQETIDNIAKMVTELTNGIDNLYLSDELITSDEQAILTKRRSYGVKLYYSMLHKVICHEKARGASLQSILSHPEFHRSILATSFELIAYAYKLDSLLFPHFVHKFGLHPFSYYRCIDSITKIDNTIPQNLVAHLRSIEDRVVEQYAWSEGSNVFSLIEKSKEQLRHLSHASNQLQPPSTPSSSSSSSSSSSFVQNFSTPTKPSSKPVPMISTPTSSSSSSSYGNKLQSPGPKPKLSPVITNFFRKVLHSINSKCKNFCGLLSLPNEVVQQIIWATVNLVIEHTDLLKNRSLDVIAISTIYAICKVNSIPKTYKMIIEATSMPTKVYKEIQMTDGTIGDIVAFYNELYLPIMDKLIHQAAEKCQYLKNMTTPTKLAPSSPRPTQPLQQLNITFSPMASRTSNDIKLTPSKLSYSIGRTPSKELKAINKNINNSSSSNIAGVSTSAIGVFGTPSKSVPNSSSTPSSSVSSTSSSSNVSPVLSSSSSSSSSDFNENITSNESNNIDTNNNLNNANKSKGKRLFFGDESNNSSISNSPTMDEPCPEPPLKK